MDTDQKFLMNSTYPWKFTKRKMNDDNTKNSGTDNNTDTRTQQDPEIIKAAAEDHMIYTAYVRLMAYKYANQINLLLLACTPHVCFTSLKERKQFPESGVMLASL